MGREQRPGKGEEIGKKLIRQTETAVLWDRINKKLSELMKGRPGIQPGIQELLTGPKAMVFGERQLSQFLLAVKKFDTALTELQAASVPLFEDVENK